MSSRRYCPIPSSVRPRSTVDARGRYFGKPKGIVRARPKRLGDILADLSGVDVERCRDLDIA